MPPWGARCSCTSSIKLRMKKMPRPLDLSMFSGASGSERELDGDDFAAILAVAVFDRVDDGFPYRDADPVDRVLVEGGQLPHAIAENLHKVHHVEEARNLQPDQAAARRH